MPAVGVKICGIADEAGMDAVAESGADWVGFNFFPPSPRFIRPAAAAALAARHPALPAVALFVDPDDEAIAEALDAVPFAALQLHTSFARALEVRDRFGIPVWHAVGVATAADLPAAELAPATALDRLLLDRKAPPGAPLPGGNAISFDWAVLRGWHAPSPWILAGGLHPGNVAAAIQATAAPAVDVSSGVERARGVKDPALIRAFVLAARQA